VRAGRGDGIRYRTFGRLNMDTTASRISVIEFDEGVVIRFEKSQLTEYGEIQVLKSEILPIIERAGKKRVVLDFGKLQLLSTPFLSLLIKIREKTKRWSGRVELCNLNRHIAEVLRITDLETIFEFCDDPLAEPAEID
jgi:anti-anti-sigma factor